MSELTRLKDEATRLLTIYEEYKDCDDVQLRRLAHVRLDRFLMEHRDIAAILMVHGLHDAFEQLVAEAAVEKAPAPWYVQLMGGIRNGRSKIQAYRKQRAAEH